MEWITKKSSKGCSDANSSGSINKKHFFLLRDQKWLCVLWGFWPAWVFICKQKQKHFFCNFLIFSSSVFPLSSSSLRWTSEITPKLIFVPPFLLNSCHPKLAPSVFFSEAEKSEASCPDALVEKLQKTCYLFLSFLQLTSKEHPDSVKYVWCHQGQILQPGLV